MADAKQQHERLPPVLTGKKALIVGVANEHSIAWGCAQAMRRAGAEIAMTYLNDRAKPHVEPLAKAVDAEIFLPLEVRDPAQVDALFAAIAERWGGLDILVHSIAFAPRDALQGRVMDCPRDGFLAAMDVSCWSFLDLARRAEPLMRQGGTMITMSYLGANEVVENYGIMGPVKAALESSVRYVATELGPKGIRVHAVSPGPLATRAASGIKRLRRADGQGLGAGAGAAARDHRGSGRRLRVPRQRLRRRDDRRDALRRWRLPHPRLNLGGSG